ncbi:MAG TPA: ArdC-like ssDNA-binding domain-containing protein [Thermoanaerobaculia bacterium]|jgi:antirestriction protein ArdC|nr:ArdC-like ssDNA-binding domain-containing protein [Thermoanaerobaculia bacterium]
MSKVYEVVTRQILEQLEQGVVPWARPWKVDGLAPSNLITRRPYRGNIFLLGLRAATTPWWLTFRQALALGGTVRAGERSAPVIFWRWAERTERADREPVRAEEIQRRERIPVLRYYPVFNLDQTDGIDPAKLPAGDGDAPAMVPKAEEILAGFQDAPAIEHLAQSRAFYRPATDTVTMPLRSAFTTPAGYHTTLFHELAHSTGHSTRLARPGFEKNHGAPFGSDACARGELVASSERLSMRRGLHRPESPNSAAYIDFATRPTLQRRLQGERAAETMALRSRLAAVRSSDR